MKKTLTLAIFAPSAALAHVGDHSAGFLQTAIHFLSAPDHTLMAVAVVALGYVVFRIKRG